MNCINCGTPQEADKDFCRKCGKLHTFSTSTSASAAVTPMTVQEYMAQTNIKSAAEAEGYLKTINGLFIAVVVANIVVRVTLQLPGDLGGLLALANLGLVIYFVYYCVKVKNAEKVCRISMLWCVIFAPISWIWLYPALTDPLKIIMGKKTPPAYIPTDEDRKRLAQAINKSFWKKLKIILAVTGIIFVLILGYNFLMSSNF